LTRFADLFGLHFQGIRMWSIDGQLCTEDVVIGNLKLA